MKKILLGILIGWVAHWLWSDTTVEVKVKPPRVATVIKTKVVAAVKPKPSCGTTCLQKKLPSLESSLAGKKKELKTRVEVKEPTAEQLVVLGIL